jgi:predicted helicase
MSALKQLLDGYRRAAATNREAGTYFEELTAKFLRTDPKYASHYRSVVPYAEFAARRGLDRRDAGIDLVAETFSDELHAVQCKLYPEEYELKKSDIDSFFTASGKEIYSRRLIVATTSRWSEHAEAALEDQQPPVTKIDLHTLEESPIDWSRFAPGQDLIRRAKKTPLPHQENAIAKVLAGFAKHERGKLVMACGTGKTFTSLKIAEKVAGEGKRVLFLVPSLALLSQTLTEWTAESDVTLRCFAVCSDADVGKKKGKKARAEDDAIQTYVHELAYPATTKADRLAAEVDRTHVADAMTVVFSTYHSIDVVHRAQHEHGLADFDLVVCDEAHRTTGATFEDEDESQFVKVHDREFLRAARRLYMTATPRVYGNAAQAAAEQQSVTLCSMDDEALYGPSFEVLTFSEAVARGLLVDYKVIVLAIEESHVSRRIQGLLADEDNSLRLDDAAKIVGCWKALTKRGLAEELLGDRDPMRRAVAFCQVIEERKGARVHRVASKTIAEMFPSVIEEYLRTAEPDELERSTPLKVEVEHVDGQMNATEKEDRIDWLKEDAPEGTCRILSNVRCLSEGVDVPALDAVLFLTPRNSQIDVVQSVGRVMRRAPGKTRGYVVLPVAIPEGTEPHEALNDNNTYKVVWQVLQALRSHDDRFDAMVNKLDLIGKDPSKMEIIAIVDKVARPKKKESKQEKLRSQAKAGDTIGRKSRASTPPEQRTLEFEIGEVERAIYAKLVQKVGNRHHWEDWAKDIAQIAGRHIERIRAVLAAPENVREREEFDRFAAELRDDLNDSITDEEIVEMLAQHLVTKPVFEALFEGEAFVQKNAVSRAMSTIVALLEAKHIDKEASTLQRFYESVKLRASGIDNAQGKQKIVVELYDKFFRHAFPKMSERLGIVYTPVEIVDFILHSVAHLLKEEFGQTLSSPGVHVLDPFTGTGTFITRLLQSGLIEPAALPWKYREEIHANELVLLAYYIAAINIEATYHGLVGGAYEPFEGICLTDTFQLYEKDDLISRVLVDNSARRTRQKALDIRVIVGNPPYSVGQASENDNNPNVSYPGLDQRISETYARRSMATNKSKLYDSYIRAIRWASDRLGDRGIVGFVTNAGFVDGIGSDGLRKCLLDDFSSLYVFHLRGNQRTSGDVSRREGGKIFGSGSRAPVAISLLVKNPNATSRGRLFFHDIGDYLTRDDKLHAVRNFGSVAGIALAKGWTLIEPDEHGDWRKQRDAGYTSHIALGDKQGSGLSLFDVYARGVTTARDAWVYDPSKHQLAALVQSTISFYNSELRRFSSAYPDSTAGELVDATDRHITADSKKISWSEGLKRRFATGSPLVFNESRIVPATYRPYTKCFLYSDRALIERFSLNEMLFPHLSALNRSIVVKQRWSGEGHLALMVDTLIDVQPDGGTQCFPLYVYGTDAMESGPLFGEELRSEGCTRRDGVTDAGITHFRDFYPGEEISKEDVFYYVYGILHSSEYRKRFMDNLGKELPRIPRVKRAEDFWAFSRAGRALGDLHVGFERVPEYPATIEESGSAPLKERYRVVKMKFGGKGKAKDKSVIVYNNFVTVRDIPKDAYDYVINGKSAIAWVMDRQTVSTDKASGIVKDANAYANETIGDPRYPLSLLLRAITVSRETNAIVAALPALRIEGDDDAALDAQIRALVEDGAVSEARALAKGTRWERVLAPPVARVSTRREDRSTYGGRWVARKDGVLVAAADSYAELMARLEERDDRNELLISEVST